MNDRELLQSFIIDTMKENLNVNYAQILRDGRPTAEYNRIPIKTRLNTWSASKGFVSCAVGIALAEGLIHLNEKIVDIFPEYVPENPGDYLPKVSLEHLLTMTSGLKESLFFCDWKERYTVKNWLNYFFQACFDKEPGTQWLYSNFNTYVLSCAIERRSGVNLLEYLRNSLFTPLGIGNPDWTLCPMGHVHAANGLYLTIDELSNYGQMICNMGNYHGKQVVPREYMLHATSNLVDNSAERNSQNAAYAGYGYGYQFICGPRKGSVCSTGNYGQFCVMLPEERLVVSVMSLEGNYPRIGTLLWNNVINNL